MFWLSRSQKMQILQIGLTPQSQVDLYYVWEDEKGRQDERHWSYSPGEIGAPSVISMETAPTLTLPTQLREGLEHALADTPKTTPLWLRFTKPYGYLGLQPWEGELIRLLARPVLRLPELFERPPEKRQVLEAAICYDAGSQTTPEDAEKQMKIIAAALTSSSPRAQTRIHLFPSAAWHQRARKIEFDQRVALYDPAGAPTAASTGQLLSNWGGWLTDVLKDCSLDSVHMVCRAECTDIGPRLLMSRAPNARGPTALCAVDVQEFGAFLTRVGAWTAIFTPPPNDKSGAALALAADTLAHVRPTVCVYQPLATPDHALAFQSACAFAFSPAPAAPPKISDGFLYCPPAMVAGYDHLHVGAILDAMRANVEVLDGSSLGEKARAWLKPWVKSIELKQAPNWASAVQRHVETLTLEELRTQSQDVLLSSQDSLRAQFDPTAAASRSASNETLEAIQKIIADHLKKPQL